MTSRDSEKLLCEEAVSFGQYLLGSAVDRTTQQLYAQACRSLKLDGLDSPGLRFARRHPWSLGMLDAAVATRASDPLRSRLFVFFAVAEARPGYVSRYLPIERSPLYIATIVATLLRAAVRQVLGRTLYALIR